MLGASAPERQLVSLRRHFPLSPAVTYPTSKPSRYLQNELELPTSSCLSTRQQLMNWSGPKR